VSDVSKTENSCSGCDLSGTINYKYIGNTWMLGVIAKIVARVFAA